MNLSLRKKNTKKAKFCQSVFFSSLLGEAEIRFELSDRRQIERVVNSTRA